MRLILIKLHLYLGLVGGALLCVVAISGALYAFEPQLRAWWGEPVNAATAETLLSPRAIEDRLRESGYEGAPTYFLWPQEKTLPMWVRWTDLAGERHEFLLDPVTGERLPRAEQARAFFAWVLDLHRTLTMGETGKLIVGFSAVSLIVLIISGLFIGVRRWKDRGRVLFASKAERSNPAPRVRWRFLHRIIGAWATPWLLLVCLTGMVWSFPAFAGFVRSLAGPDRFPAAPTAPGSTATASSIPLDIIWERCMQARSGDNAMRLILPTTPGQAARFEWAPPQVASFAMRSRLYFDPATGEVLEAQAWEEFSKGEQLVRWAFPLHTGRVWGIFGQTLAFVGSLTVPFFFATGLYLYIARRARRSPVTLNNHQPCKHEKPKDVPSPI